MARSRRETGTLRKRGAIWWIRYHVAGDRYEESTGTGDRRAAETFLAALRRDIRAGKWKAPSERASAERIAAARAELAAALAASPEHAPLTVRAYLESWCARRLEAGVRKAKDERRYFDVHVIPEIGSMPLDEVRRRHVKALIAKVGQHVSETTGKPLASRTVLHVYRTLATAFADAREDELVPASPCSLRMRRGELPRKRDADPTWRREAVFRREELEALLGDPRIPLDRQVLYSLLGCCGLRSSEAHGATWASLDLDAEPMPRLVVATQAENGQELRETKTGEVREVPVIEPVAALLRAWKAEGFALLFGRHPRPSDPIVPSRASTRDRMRMRSKRTLETLVDDLARIGLRRVPSARHALRATFLSLLEIDGANIAIARRATHAAPEDVVGGYVRVGWADVCREVAKLNVHPRAVQPVGQLAAARARLASSTYAGDRDSGRDSAPAMGAFLRKSERGGRDSKTSASRDNRSISGSDGHEANGSRPEDPREAIGRTRTGTRVPVRR